MTLHIISRSPSATPVLDDCLEVVAPGDAILFIDDGVYGITQAKHLAQQSTDAGAVPLPIFALAPHVAVRGLKGDTHVTQIDFTQFVELCVQHPTIQSWY